MPVPSPQQIQRQLLWQCQRHHQQLPEWWPQQNPIVIKVEVMRSVSTSEAEKRKKINKGYILIVLGANKKNIHKKCENVRGCLKWWFKKNWLQPYFTYNMTTVFRKTPWCSTRASWLNQLNHMQRSQAETPLEVEMVSFWNSGSFFCGFAKSDGKSVRIWLRNQGILESLNVPADMPSLGRQHATSCRAHGSSRSVPVEQWQKKLANYIYNRARLVDPY